MMRVGGVLLKIFIEPTTVALFVISFVAYYILFLSFLSLSGAFVIAAPLPLVYLLIATSAVLLTVSAYAIKIGFSSSMLSHGAGISSSAITALLGTFFVSCSCTAPLLAPILYLIGLNVFEVSGIIATVSSYQSLLISMLIIVNLAVIAYQVRRISKNYDFEDGRFKKVISREVKVKTK